MAGRWKDTSTADPGQAAVVTGEDLLNAVRGHRLAEIRRSRGLTQHHLAEKMGVSQSHLHEIERGTVANRDALVQYALALGGRLRQTIHFDDGDIAVVE